MRFLLLLLVTLLAQRALGWPGLPSWAVDLQLPMVWLVQPSMRGREALRLEVAVLIGVLWDLALEDVVGPGGIAWSAAALVVAGLAAVIADRGPRAWLVLGGVGAGVALLVRQAALLPLGEADHLRWPVLLRTILLTATWCGLVGWSYTLELPRRWRQYRARRLR